MIFKTYKGQIILLILPLFLIIGCALVSPKAFSQMGLPMNFVNILNISVGADGMKQIDYLSTKYNFEKQDFFKDPKFFSDGVKHKADLFAHFLNSVGNEISTRGQEKDAETAFLLSLKIKPQYNPAHISLALLYAQEKRYDVAKREAVLALDIVRGMRNQMRGALIPKEIMPPGTIDKLESQLYNILKH